MKKFFIYAAIYIFFFLLGALIVSWFHNVNEAKHLDKVFNQCLVQQFDSDSLAKIAKCYNGK